MATINIVVSLPASFSNSVPHCGRVITEYNSSLFEVQTLVPANNK